MSGWGRRILRRSVVAVAAAGLLTVPVSPPARASVTTPDFEVMVSRHADHTSAISLAGATLRGTVYVWTPALTRRLARVLYLPPAWQPGPDAEVGRGGLRLWVYPPNVGAEAAPWAYSERADGALDTTALRDGQYHLLVQFTPEGGEPVYEDYAFAVANTFPQAPTAQPRPATHSVVVTWAAVPGAARYRVDSIPQAPGSGAPPGQPFTAVTTGTSYYVTHVVTDWETLVPFTITAYGATGAVLGRGQALTPAPATSMGRRVWFSRLPDRSAPQLLKGARVSGRVYVFTDVPGRCEIGWEPARGVWMWQPPYDCQGTAPDGSALPLDTRRYPDGGYLAWFSRYADSRQAGGSTVIPFTIANGVVRSP